MDASSPRPPAGYSGTPLVRKLGIKESMTVVALHAPPQLATLLGPLPAGATLRTTLAKRQRCDLLIGFVTERSHLAKNLPRLLDALGNDGVLWVAWPKRSSSVPTDMSDGVVREVVLPTGWVDTKVCAVDETWSALKFVLRIALRPTNRKS